MIAVALDLVLAAQSVRTRHRHIYCCCGRLLLAGDIPLGHRLALDLQRCHCGQFHTLLFNEQGDYWLADWPYNVRAESIPWPAGAWK